MNRFTGFAAATALAMVPALGFAEGSWSGPYIGAQAGVNSTSASHGISSESALNLGLLGGYNYQLTNGVVLGGNLFYEWNEKKSHAFPGPMSAKVGTDVYGLDLMAGLPVGQGGAWLPYVKLGYGWADFTGDGGNGISTQNRSRMGLGVAWRVQPMMDVNVQYMYQKFGGDAADWKNQNYTVGVTWYFQ